MIQCIILPNRPNIYSVCWLILIFADSDIVLLRSLVLLMTNTEYSCLGIQQVTKLYMPDSTDLVEIVYSIYDTGSAIDITSESGLQSRKLHCSLEPVKTVHSKPPQIYMQPYRRSVELYRMVPNGYTISVR